MMATTKRPSHWWWFDSHKNSHSSSQWLQSTLSELDEKTNAMLKIIEEDADSFAQRAEMYYKKRPQLVSMVEDFYRAHRSLAEQFDHLRHDPASRRTSPLARSFSVSTGRSEKLMDPRKSYDGCFTKAYDSDEFLSPPLSKGSSEKSLQPPKLFGGRYTELAYDSEESMDSEVDDPIPEVNYEGIDWEEEISSSCEVNLADLMAEIDKLSEENKFQKKQLMDKDRAIEELKQKLYKSAKEVMEVKEEAENLRLENVEMYLGKMKEAEERDQLATVNATLGKLLQDKEEEKREAMKMRDELAAVQRKNMEQRELLKGKDEEKREAIRQLSMAIEMMKGENRLLKKTLTSEINKKWNPFELQVLKGFGKLIGCSFMSQPTIVPL